MIKKPLGLLLIILSMQSIAQKNNISPYSSFGLGENTTEKTVVEISMGQIGAAFSSPYELSFSNPASLSSLRFTTYALAGENKVLTLDDGNNSETASSSSLSYVALGIPIGTKAGFSFGIQPNSSVGYSLLQETRDNDDNLTAFNEYIGNGGTNRVFLGFGYQLFEHLSLGVEAAYIFGNIENSLLSGQAGNLLATKYETNESISGAKIKAGLLYDAKINDKLTLNVGGVIDFNNELSSDGEEYLFSLLNTNSDIVLPRDTIVNNTFTNKVKNPLKTTISTGIGQESKWYAGVEYSFQEAVEGILNLNTDVSYDKSNRISVGGFYIPKYNSISSYWSRVTYRAGFNYKNTGLVVNDTELNDFGMSFGVGLPMGKQLSNINLGFEFGKRGEVNNGLIKEKYLNFRLSLTLNDKWFKKRKLD